MQKLDERAHANNMLGELASFFTSFLFESALELVIKQPLNTGKSETTMGLITQENSWLTPIIDHCNQKTNITYEPLLEIMQVKKQELAALVRNLTLQPFELSAQTS